jgi:hypothetical protein
VNSDNVWLDGPTDAFRELSDAWDPARMDALLLLVPAHPRSNFRGKGDFHMDGKGRLTRRRSGRIAPFIFNGVQLIAKRLLRDAPGAVLDQRAVEPGDRGRAALRQRPSPASGSRSGDPQAIRRRPEKRRWRGPEGGPQVYSIAAHTRVCRCAGGGGWCRDTPIPSSASPG